MSSATVTCEKCHARARLGGFRERRFNYYASDEANTPNEMRMLINTGAADSMLVSGFGIHYHMLAASKVEYVALDQKRQEIAWLRVTRADGTTEEFEHQDYAVGEEERRELPVREMSCLDCHNRPAHPFRAPQDLVNAALANGKLDRTLPSLKVEAVRALDGGYGSTEEAMEGIAEAVRGFYEGEYPEIAQEKAAQIDQAVETLQSMYRHSFFPDMQAQWSAYPNNIGHRDWPGCFRCHSDFMVSTTTDEPLFTECTACHVILAQGESLQGDDVEISLARVFYHPGYDEEIEEYSQCIDCHTGGADLY